jgi:hypothetical protein
MDNLWLWVILAGLANYKAAHMISQKGDDGPFDLFKTIRDWAGETNWFGKGLHCFSCTSFWGGLIAALLINPGLPVNLFLIGWGAISTISYMIWRYFG